MTKEEAIEHIRLMRLNAAISDAKSFREALDIAIDALSQPSLPSNLDEAAEEYIKFKPRYDIQQELEEGEDPTEIDCFTIDAAIDIFKAGAEWMAGQGETRDDIVVTEGFDNKAHIFPIPSSKFNPGDKVVVQIRKKQ